MNTASGKTGGFIQINELACDNCGTCVAVCREDALRVNEKRLMYTQEKCDSCYFCVRVCPVGAITPSGEANNNVGVVDGADM